MGNAKKRRNPFDLGKAKAIFREVYEKWSVQKLEDAPRNTIDKYRGAYNVCSYIYEHG